tara:strand:+ start:551 stop:1051 length:501 start_codon:yes stop_codon:yes gene_type:complete
MKIETEKITYKTYSFVLIAEILDQYAETIKENENIDVREKGRKREKCDLVKIFCYHAKENLELSYTKIGEYLGRTHATVLVASRKYNDFFFSDEEFREKAEFYIDRFKSIDGHDNPEPNKDRLIEFILRASESTRGDWLNWITEQELVIKYPNEIEVIDSETVAHE